MTSSPRRLSVRPLWRKVRRPLLWGLAILYFGFAAVFLSLRYVVLPNIANYKGDIELAMSKAIHLPVTIAGIEADWQGLRPRLTLRNMQVADNSGRPALGFDHVEAVLGWSSFLHLEVRLHRLDIDAPALSVRREANGQIFIAGLAISDDGEGPGFSDWVLAQEQIVIRDATIAWTDMQRGAPPLALRHVNLNLQNWRSRHLFGLTAEPPPELATRLDLRGDFHGRDLDDFATAWKGQVYAELDYADLAIWRTWVDYPIELPRGSGGLRLWLDFDRKQPMAATMDLALSRVQVRLAKDLPMLDIDHVEGRLSAQRSPAGYVLEGKKFALLTRTGSGASPSIAPTDFKLAWNTDAADEVQHVDARVSTLDLGKLAALAAYLPLPEQHREQLVKHAPRGQLKDFSLAWTRPPAEKKDARPAYAVKGVFTDLGLEAQEDMPGIQRLSGNIDATEKGGRLEIASQDLQIDLPALFTVPEMDWQKLNAKLKWQLDGAKHTVTLENSYFSNRDLEGTASATYTGQEGAGPGNLDLNGLLTRVDATQVWRYLPNEVGKDARDWVKAGITAGRSNEVRFALKGPLAHFPFRNNEGTFKVALKAQGITIAPAPGWPAVQGIEGDINFVGPGMHIVANKAQIMGTTVSNTHADIVDLDGKDQTLTIAGKVTGPTQEFLRFIDASPVAGRTGNFTAGMTAAGNGALDLKLKLALHDINRSTVEGSYQFDNNRLVLNGTIPPISEARGKLDFTEDVLAMKDGRANMLGAPVTVNIATAKNGDISVLADGQYTVAALKKNYPYAVFDQLSGGGKWKGNIAIRKGEVDARISSDLVGLTSNLPEPFNKTAAVPMDLKFERRLLPSDTSSTRGKKDDSATRRESSEIVLGKLMRTQFVRLPGSSEIQRGYLAVGGSAVDAAKLPDKGATLAVSLPRVDIDFWRRMAVNLPAPPAVAGTPTTKDPSTLPATPPAVPDAPATQAQSGLTSSFPFNQVELRANEVVVINRTLSDVKLSAQLAGRNWKGDFRSKGVTANLEWLPGEGSRPGRITGRIPQLAIPNPNEQVAQITNSKDEDPSQLPSLALVIDQFSMRGIDWGSVKLDAENRAGYWNFKAVANNPDGNLTADGKWKPDAAAPDTRVDFKLKSESMGRLLTRMGYADALKRGAAEFEGNLSWNGAPFSMDYPTLHGSLKMDMQKGQFNKLEPGIGRLLGILSLQSLPRRLTLDFRDVFSEGFAFDRIHGDFNVKQGVMDTQNLVIKGPAAEVNMSGKVDLDKETQDLNVRVQPALGETLAVATLLANPVVGLGVWLGQKVLKDPIDRAFAFQYTVTGKWDDPQVKKVETGRDANKELLREANEAAKAETVKGAKPEPAKPEAVKEKAP